MLSVSDSGNNGVKLQSRTKDEAELGGKGYKATLSKAGY